MCVPILILIPISILSSSPAVTSSDVMVVAAVVWAPVVVLLWSSAVSDVIGDVRAADALTGEVNVLLSVLEEC